MYQWTEEFKSTEDDLRQEIAELKTREAQLQQSRSLVISTLESTAHGIISVGIQGDILSFNKKFVDMWQIPETLISQKYFQCQAWFKKQLRDPQAYVQMIWGVSGQCSLDKFDVLELNDGRVFAQYSQPQWLNGKIIGRVWSFWDITESRRREELPQFNQAKLWSLAETINVCIFVIKRGNLSYMNPAAEVITGYTTQDLLTGFDPCQLFKNKKLRMVDNKDLEYQEIKILEKNGRERWLACVVAIINDQETPMEIMAGIDITDYKKAEFDLSKNLEKIKEVSQLQADFMSMVCHQFRTPLNVVSFSNSLVKRHIDKCHDQKTQPLLDHIQSSVEQLTKMLDDILFFAKVEATKLNCDAQPLNLVEFCNELIAKMQTNGRSNNINFLTQTNYITAFMDQKLLEPMIRNLLDNAIKYSPIDSVVDLKLSSECGKVIFEVTDRGIGIPLTDRARLFEPFYRGSNIHHLPGTGLGLSIVKTLVDLQKGHIAVESEVGVGTTFTIMLSAIKSNLSVQ